MPLYLKGATMPNATFPRMMTDYLRKRAAPLFPPRELERLRLHLLDLPAWSRANI